VKKLLALVALLPSLAFGQVNFLDPLAYEKPEYIDLGLPATSVNSYYVAPNGAGTACTTGSPCALSGVVGKPGTAGSGTSAIVYVKGDFGQLNTSSLTIRGYTGNPVIFRPWPSDTTPATFTAAGGCGVNDANRIYGSGFNNVVFDGGTDMLIRFVGSGCTSSQNGYALTVGSNDITLYRVRVNANNGSGPALGPAVGSGTSTSNFRFINSEIYGATKFYGVYSGGGTGCSAGDTSHTNMEFRNNVFRNIDGRGIQIEPRANSNGVTITGNAFHDIGYNRDGDGFGISGAVQLANACGGTISGVTVANNLMWDLGGGGVLLYGGGSTNVYNNTIYDYGKQTSPTLNSHGITCFNDGCTGNASYNIVIPTASTQSGLNPINRDPVTTNRNVCNSSSAAVCGANARASTATDAFQSTDPNNANFLKIKPTFTGVGYANNVGLTTDYFGTARPDGSGQYDVGAGQASTGVATPPTLTLNTTNATPTLGTSFDLDWVVGGGGATSCTASGAWSGAKNPAGGTESFTATVTGSYVLVCTGAGGDSPIRDRTVTVPAPVVSLSASPLSIYEGAQTTVQWSATNATTCTASSSPAGNWTGSKTATVGPHFENVTLTVSSGLSLTCTSTAGSTTPPAVTVNASPRPPPPVIGLSASPQTVTAGNASTITWTVSGDVSTCTGLDATQGNFAGWNSAKSTAGGTFATGNLAASGVWTLACSGAGGPGTTTIPITVNAALPEPTAVITINPSSVLAGYYYDVIWDSTNAVSCTATGAWSALGSIAPRGTLGRNDTPPTTFGLTCTNASGSASDSADINLTPTTPLPVNTEFSATVGGAYGSIANGSTHPTGTVIRLTWYGFNASATGCTATGDYAAAGLSRQGEYEMPPLAGDIQVTMSCTDGVTTSVKTLNFYEEDVITPPAAPTLTFTASPMTILQGESSTLTWDSTNALSCVASGGWSGGRGADGEEDTIALGQTTRFYLLCTGEGGSIQKETAVTVRRTSRWPWCRWWRCR